MRECVSCAIDMIEAHLKKGNSEDRKRFAVRVSEL
jgi:hypothetical protein